MPLDGSSFDQMDEIVIVRIMQAWFEDENRWCKNILSEGMARCPYGLLNAIDHDTVHFLKWSNMSCQFKNPAVFNVHKRLCELAHSRLSWRWRIFSKWFGCSVMIYNDTRSTTHADIMRLLADAKVSFEMEQALVIA